MLAAAVARADEHGIEALTMRRLGQDLGVEAMSLYNHVSNKDDILNGVVEVVAGEVLAAAEAVALPDDPAGWKPVMRGRILAAREVLLRHRWAPAVLETRTTAPPAVLQHYDALLGLMLAAGFSIDLAHHALHALGSRTLGFTQELKAVYHDTGSALGSGCDDQFEFEFGLDLILDGLERLRAAAWQLPEHA